MKEISSFQTGQLVALATDVSPWIHTDKQTNTWYKVKFGFTLKKKAKETRTCKSPSKVEFNILLQLVILISFLTLFKV